MHAAAITRDELQWPVDRLPAIPSYELSGVVEEVGPGVAGVAAGDEVFALTPFDRDGVAADYTAVPAELLVARPRALGHAESAAIPLPALTAWQGLFDHGRLGAGERVLIHGAAGGVGAFAVQLARARGAHVIGTASAANLGWSASSAHTRPSTRRRASRTRWSPSTSCSTPSAASGCAGPSRCCAPAGDWSRWRRSRRMGACTSSSSRIATSSTSIARLADAGELRPPSVEIFPLASAREAFARSLERGRRGKVVLAV